MKFPLLPPAAQLVLWLLLAAIVPARSHVPVPASVLDPQTAPEAWNVLRLATDNVERLLREDRLPEVPNQISLCSPALRALGRLANVPAVTAGTVQGAVAINSLAQASLVGDRAGAERTLAELRATLREMASSFDAPTVHADIFFCPMHPEVLAPDPAVLCSKCGMTLNPRRIPYSFIYVPPGEPSIQLTARTDAPLAAARQAQVTIRLQHRDGSPVELSDLEVTHTQPIHLLIVDPAAREDYHHEHPVPTDTPGEYTFRFTPAKATSYRIFADLVPAANGVQEFASADLPGISETASGPAPRQGDALTATVNSLRFRLACGDNGDSPLPARRAHRLRITVSEADGHPMQRLEPVMNAFAHLVGFYDDGQTVVHLHPAGGEILNPDLRGGPSMDFLFFPPKPGHLRLFCQVLVDGRMIFAPFDANIVP